MIGPARRTRVRAPQLRAPEHRGDAGAQLRVGERLLDDVVAATIEHPNPLQPVGVAAQHDQRRVRVRPASGSLAGADRVDKREGLAVDVDEDQVGVRSAQQRERLRPVGRDQHPVAVSGEVGGEERARGVVLLGDQDGRSGLGHVTSSEVVVVNL